MRLIFEFYLNITKFIVIFDVESKSDFADVVLFGQTLKCL